VPRHVRIVDELPMTPTGKIRRVEQREQALSDFGDPRHG
jgi:acyl-coenzyme A synthetase/AMP-(fatty) acid ligase